MHSFKTPLEALRHHVSGAIERGEKQAIVEIPGTLETHKYRVTLHDKSQAWETVVEWDVVDAATGAFVSGPFPTARAARTAAQDMESKS